MKKPYFFMQWDATSRCNLNCLHCYHTKEERDNRYVLTDEEAKAMLDDFSKTLDRWGFQGGIHFSGGEPLTRRSIFDLAEYASNRSLKLRMLSNGTLITKDIARKLKDIGFNIIQVSIDGDRQTHNHLRNAPDAYERAIRGIGNLSEQGIEPTAATTLTKTNSMQLEHIIQQAYEAGAARIGFSQLVPEGSGKDLEMLSKEELFRTYMLLNELSQKYAGKIEILRSESLWCLFNEDTAYSNMAKERGILAGGCSIGMSGISVLSDGTVYPCRRLPIPLGNIREGFANIFINNELLNKFRDIKNYECKECDKVTICRGCRAVAYASTGNPFAKDPQCFYKLMEERQ
ncbi:MAG: radical SAM protein [Nanoarchaeota archaeon]|nr:radical SAM protein [Nanoarchaeota archaeon]